MTPDMYRIPYMSFGESLLASALGFSIVFVVLIILQYMIIGMRAFMEKRDAAMTSAAPAAASATARIIAAPPANMIPAKGSLGEIKLHEVDDKTAALIMAIVANEMNAPLNELRFLSIREKK